MFSFLLRPRVALFAAALAIPVVASGACGSRTACIAFSQGEYAANNNSCLAPSEAIASFTSASCPGPIVSVDGPGTFDGEICCYPVTYDSLVQSCGETSTTGDGFGGGETAFPPTGPGTTTVETTTTCSPSCSFSLMVGTLPCANPVALSAFQQLQTCAGCNDVPTDAGTDCEGQCPSFCSGGALDPSCVTCLMTFCASQFQTCEEN